MADRASLESALIRAHESGDTEAAQLFAEEIKKLTPGLTEGKSSSQLFLMGLAKAGGDQARGAQQFGATISSPTVASPRAMAMGAPAEFDPTKVQALQERQKGIQESINTAKTRDEPLMKTGAGLAGNVAGNLAMLLPTAFVPGANTYSGATAIGALSGLLSPVATGESRTTNTALGAGAGLGGQAIANTIGRLAHPFRSQLTPRQTQLAGTLEQAGVPLDASQLTGSKVLSNVNAAMSNLPLSAGAEQTKRVAQQEAFNRAVGASFGAEGPALTDDVVTAARNKISREFTNLAARNTLDANKLDGPLALLERNLIRNNTPDVARVARNRIDDILERVTPQNTITGQAYRNLDSEIGSQARKAANGDLRNALHDVQNVLREAMDASISPQDQAAWHAVRGQYANMMRAGESTVRSPTGDVSPLTLLNRVQGGSGGRPATPELRELSRAGAAFLPSRVGDSGTAQRLLYQGLLTGGAGGLGYMGTDDPMKAGAIAGVSLMTPRAIQALINSPAGRAYLSRGLFDISPVTQGMLRSAGTAGLLGLAQE